MMKYEKQIKMLLWTFGGLDIEIEEVRENKKEKRSLSPNQRSASQTRRSRREGQPRWFQCLREGYCLATVIHLTRRPYTSKDLHTMTLLLHAPITFVFFNKIYIY
jgi:FtsZ-binding cell division protein ZapB